ncbi:MAG: nucleotidyltransferase family protein [Clostridia bacterium]|nr:nucleotidyltransferase family protein [Clostridia bacterium]
MKICAIICEYNPFHNGHAYHIRQAKALTGADAVLCLMSGNFVQRGEAAILDKRTRAKHALLFGADAVLELPVLFATSNAELFAKGALSLLAKIPDVTHLCFGAEHADKEEFLRLAALLNDEPQEVSTRINALLGDGLSYAKSYATAWTEFSGSPLLSSPNDILGLEYTKAILAQNSQIEIVPVKREGNGYLDESLSGVFASASAVRKGLLRGERECVASQLPHEVFSDLPKTVQSSLSIMERTAILLKSKEELRGVLDCAEGLENALKRAAAETDGFVEKLTSTRYTASRIRRIALHTLLNIREDFIRDSLNAPLYLAPLGYRKERADLLASLSRANLPFLASGKDVKALTGVARECFEKEEFADLIYAVATGVTPNSSPILL